MEAAYALHNWPTPVVFSGWEIGGPIQTGPRLYTETGEDNPVRRAYEIYLGWRTGRNLRTRSSFDQTAVLYAVRGLGERWTLSEPGVIRVNLDDGGSNTWVSDPDRDPQIAQRYLVKKAANSEIAKEIDDLMVTPPAK